MTTNRFSMAVALTVLAVFAILSMGLISSPHRVVSTSSPYDQIELVRAQRYAAASSASYDQIELMRAQRYSAAVSSTSANDQIELVRAQRYAAAAAQQAYLDYRHGEWTAGEDSFSAHLQNRP